MVLGLDSGRVSGSTKTPRNHSVRAEESPSPKGLQAAHSPWGVVHALACILLRRAEVLCLRFTVSYESRHQYMITLKHWDILLHPDGAMGSSYV